MRFWDLTTGSRDVLYESRYELYGLAIPPDGSAMVAIDRTGGVVVIDSETGETSSLEPANSGGALTFTPNGETLALTGEGGTVLWDFESGRISRELLGNFYPAVAGVFVNAGSELYVSSGEGFIRGYYLDPLDLVEQARSETTRSLTDDECDRYLETTGGCES